MPKLIELTVELDVQRVSCPGVWLCQDGRVSLTVFALGTSYQTCMLPPLFPLMFKDVFYFRKRFQETCNLNNICCLLKDETIYCELVQWCEDCMAGECTILAQYLGALNDVLFPPNMCSNDGIDLLMRRSKDFPGILSPKIEITTKVRIDEVWDQSKAITSKSTKVKACGCKAADPDPSRQNKVCHTSQYHRSRCDHKSQSLSRSRSRSGGSSCSLPIREPELTIPSTRPAPATKPRVWSCRTPPRRKRSCLDHNVYNVQAPAVDSAWREVSSSTQGHTNKIEYDYDLRTSSEADRQILESQYVDQDRSIEDKPRRCKKYSGVTRPCVCEICKRYYELFHSNRNNS